MTRRAADLGALERRLVAVWAEQHGAHCGDDIALALGTRVSIDSAGEVFDARDGSTPDALLAELRASRPHLFKSEPTSTSESESAPNATAPDSVVPDAPTSPSDWIRTLRAIGGGRAADAPAMAAPSPVARSVPSTPGDALDELGLPIAPTTPAQWALILGGKGS